MSEIESEFDPVAFMKNLRAANAENLKCRILKRIEEQLKDQNISFNVSNHIHIDLSDYLKDSI